MIELLVLYTKGLLGRLPPDHPRWLPMRSEAIRHQYQPRHLYLSQRSQPSKGAD